MFARNRRQNLKVSLKGSRDIAIKFSGGGTASGLVNLEFQWLSKAPSFFPFVFFAVLSILALSLMPRDAIIQPYNQT